MLRPIPLALPVTNQTLDMKSPLCFFDTMIDQRISSRCWRAVPFKIDVRRTRLHEATQIHGRSSRAGGSPVGHRPFVCHNDPPDAIPPSPKDDPSDAPADVAFSNSVPTPRG